jgi:endonuclease YncB( thermonuclease family)
VKYLKNYDADTITVEIPGVHPLFGEKIGVRVNGIDTAEMKGKLPCEKDAARTAQRLVANLLKNAKRIDLKNVARDKYFRVLADVEVDGKLISEFLLKNNLAYEYHGSTKQKIDWCTFQKRGVATEN